MKLDHLKLSAKDKNGYISVNEIVISFNLLELTSIIRGVEKVIHSEGETQDIMLACRLYKEMLDIYKQTQERKAKEEKVKK